MVRSYIYNNYTRNVLLCQGEKRSSCFNCHSSGNIRWSKTDSSVIRRVSVEPLSVATEFRSVLLSQNKVRNDYLFFGKVIIAVLFYMMYELQKLASMDN